MLQRIQTVWLLLAAIAFTLLFFLPIARIGDFYISSLFVYDNSHVERVMWDLAILVSLIVILTLVTIFLFKKRRTQMHLCILNVLLSLGHLALVFFQGFRFSRILQDLGENFGLTPTVWLILPILAIVFFVLAFRNIRKDDILVRMSNRLR